MARQLELFTASFVEYLKRSSRANFSNYTDSDAWCLSVPFLGQRGLPTKLSAPKAAEFVQTNSVAADDARNAVLVHSSLPSLTPAQATDERLWARLTHVEYWAYMRKRWPIERARVGQFSEDKAERYILSRYFVPDTQGRALVRNGISRLWWAAQLTCDNDRDNPYELTEVLFATLDIAQTILERSLGRSRTILFAFLTTLLLNRETLLVGGEESRLEIRHLAKFLNLAGGVSILDSLQERELIELLQSELASKRAEPSSSSGVGVTDQQT